MIGMAERIPIGVATPVSPEEESPVTDEGSGAVFSDEEFQHRVNVVMAAIEDPEKFRRAVAEIHTYLSMFDIGMRRMQAEMQGMGPMAMMKKMMGRA